jgi:hypothetical protein
VTLDDLNRRFASRPADTPQTRHIRGTGLAVAQDWLIRLPAGEEKDTAIDHLDAAVVWACEAHNRNQGGGGGR